MRNASKQASKQAEARKQANEQYEQAHLALLLFHLLDDGEKPHGLHGRKVLFFHCYQSGFRRAGAGAPGTYVGAPAPALGALPPAGPNTDAPIAVLGAPSGLADGNAPPKRPPALVVAAPMGGSVPRSRSLRRAGAGPGSSQDGSALVALGLALGSSVISSFSKLTDGRVLVALDAAGGPKNDDAAVVLGPPPAPNAPRPYVSAAGFAGSATASGACEGPPTYGKLVITPGPEPPPAEADAAAP